MSSPGLDRPRIWQYWETAAGRQKPTYISLCQEAVRRVCASCEVTLVTPENLPEFLPDLPFDLDALRLRGETPPVIALKADYIRMALLERHGGMWLDSDCVPLVDLGPVMMDVLARHEFWAMRKQRTTNKVSNGAMASVAGGRIVSECLERMGAILGEALERGRGLKWNEIGLKVLTPTVDRHAATCHLEPEENFHPIHHQEAHRWWTPSDRERLADILGPDAKLAMLFNALATPEQRSRTRRQLLNGNALVSQALRRALGLPAPRPETRPEIKPAPRFGPADVEVVFTTLKRPDTCLDFVRSIRAVLGAEIGVHVVVQGADHPAYREAETRHACRVSYLEDDAGVSAGRNHGVAKCERPLVFLCDDDFIFDERLELRRALDVMADHPDIAVLGGLVENHYYGPNGRPLGEPVPTAFNHLAWTDGQRLNHLPVQYLEMPRTFLDETFYLRDTDTVNNLALMRRSLFTDHGLRWDEGCRTSGQHELFYHDFHRLPGKPGRVCYTNLIIAQHHRRMNEELKGLRRRRDSVLHAMQRMGVNTIRILGKRLDLVTDHGLERVRDRWWQAP